MITALSPETQTLHAELMERLLTESARRTVAKAPGTFTKKELQGETYVYFQYSEPGGRYRQLYLGKQGPVVEKLIKNFQKERPEEKNIRADIERLCSQILVGGGWSMGHRPARVLKAFADAGLFEAGTVLVGTHAFGLMGNLLGIRWKGAHLRTQDLDLAAIALAAVSNERPVDAPGALDRLAMGFLPVPGLDSRQSSTSFKVRGGSLRVDFLTPGRGERPVALPRLGTSAHPLPYLDFLLENPERGAVLDAGGFLTLIPSPARFALHKLIIAGERSISHQGKVEKDLAQGAELIAFLSDSRPGDLRLAADALRRRGWMKKLAGGWKNLLRRHPETAPAAHLLGISGK